MATIRAVASGPWSTPATWFDSISPAPGDTVVSNGFSINVDGTFEVFQVRNDGASFGFTNGGAFYLLAGSDLTCTGNIQVNLVSNYVIQCSVGLGLQATLRANLPATIPTTANYVGLLFNGAGTLNIIGSVSFNGGFSGRHWINSTSGGTLSIVGNVATVSGGSSGSNVCIIMVGGKLLINGIVSGGGSASGQTISGTNCIIDITGQVNTTGVANIISGGGSVTVTGNLTNTGGGVAINTVGGVATVNGSVNIGSSGGGITAGAGAVTIGGSVTCTSSGTGLTTTGGTVNIGSFISCSAAGQGVNSTTGTVNVSGSVTITGSGVGVVSTTGAVTIGGNIAASISNNAVVGQGLVKCSGVLTSPGSHHAVYAPRITIEPTTTSITFQKITGGNQIMYIGSSTAYNLPATNNVRSGSVYGQSNEYTGTMIVQTPENVLLGTLVDNTVGTLIMTPANLITELNTSGTPVAVRLRNCATVSTTGDQMASYSI